MLIKSDDEMVKMAVSIGEIRGYSKNIMESVDVDSPIYKRAEHIYNLSMNFWEVS